MKTAPQPTTHSFMRHNGIFLAGSLVVGALNYLFYPVVARLLDPAAFGEVQALVSLFLQSIVFLSVLGMVTVNIVANYKDAKLRDRVVLELEKIALGVSLALLLLMIAGQSVLQSFLHFDSAWPFIVLGLAITVTVPLTLRSSYLRGRHSFGHSIMAMIVGAGSKLVFAVILVLAGFGTVGAMAGIVLGQLLAFGYAAVYARKRGFTESLRTSFVRRPDLDLLRPELSYMLLVLIGSLTITALYSIDTIVVKHFFDEHTAGLYAGIAAVARIIFFITVPIAQVLMAAVKLDQPASVNTRLLIKSCGLVMIIGGLAHVVFWLFPQFVIMHLMGTAYLTYASLLPRLSLVVLIISLLNVFVVYYLALRRAAIAVISIVGGVVVASLMTIHHSSLAAIIDSLLYGSLSLAAALALWQGSRMYKNSRLEAGSV